MNKTLNSVIEAANDLPTTTQEKLGREWLQDIRLAQSETSLVDGRGVPAKEAFDRVRTTIKATHGL